MADVTLNAPDRTTSPMLQLEALRRRAGQPASSAGIGAEAANMMTPENPLAQAGLTTNPPAPPSGGAAGLPTAGATQQLKQEKGEAQTIIDALIYRLKRLTPTPGSQEQAI